MPRAGSVGSRGRGANASGRRFRRAERWKEESAALAWLRERSDPDPPNQSLLASALEFLTRLLEKFTNDLQFGIYNLDGAVDYY